MRHWILLCTVKPNGLGLYIELEKKLIIEREMETYVVDCDCETNKVLGDRSIVAIQAS